MTKLLPLNLLAKCKKSRKKCFCSHQTCAKTAFLRVGKLNFTIWRPVSVAVDVAEPARVFAGTANR